jgi:hypothetical protein
LKLETATRAFRGSFCGIDFLFNLFFELHRNTHSWFVLVFCRLCQIAQFFHLAARFAAAFAAPLAASNDEVSNFDRRMEGFRLPLLGNRTGNCLRRVGGRLEVRHSSTDRIMSDPQRDAHESIGVV